MSGQDDETPGEPRTVFSPSTGFSAAPVSAPPVSAASSPTGEPRRIQVGDVLNHIFEVQRFIAQGGMGEVFEGININSDERVAIKGILPHLAADPAVQAMFRKEARTLTRLSHPALVQYRVLAQEPVLKAFYIVTEYIDGANLSNVLKDIHPGPAELTMLAQRLAAGLAAAHQLGAIHRDISPDNVMLEDGRLDRAKIIDFGIAKDLDASTGTIVGDGFAGKLNYVAPEQLGDFNREVGPWTDVYSLGLTILSVARGRDVDMGATLVDAVDKRRAGPDLSPIPESLRPVLEKMLRPNPVDRARSMEEVLALLASPPVQIAAASAPPAPKKVAPATPEGNRGKLLVGGGVAAALVLAGGGYMLLGRHAAAPGPVAPTAAVANPADVVRQTLAAELPNVGCAWLDVANVEDKGGGVSVAFRGVAGKPAEVQGQIGKLLAAKGLQASDLDFNDVSPIDAHECGPLDAFRAIRAAGGQHLTVPQRSFRMVKLGTDAGADAGKMGAQAILNVDLNGLPDDMTLVGLEPSGTMTQFVSTKRDITDSPGIDKPQPGVYRITLNTTHAGWSGILMVMGKAPFDASLMSGPAGSHGGDWPQRFLKLARERGWSSEMVWYRTTDQ